MNYPRGFRAELMSKKIFYGWWIVLACLIINLYVSSILFFGFTALIDPLIQEFGWSYTQVSFAVSLRGMEMGIFAPLIGFLTDRYGARKLILAGILAVSLGLVLFSRTQSLLMFYGVILILGFGAGGCTTVVTTTVVANWFKKNLGKALGLMSTGFGASGLMIPLIVWLIDAFQWRIMLLFLGVGFLILGIPLLFVIRDKPEDYGLLPDGDPGFPGSPQETMRPPKNPIRFWEALRHRSFLYLNLAEVVRMMLVSAVVTHSMPYLNNLGMSRASAALVVAGIPLSSILGRLGYGWLADRFPKRDVLALAFGAMGLGMAAFSYAAVPAMILLFLLFFPPSFGGSMVLRGAILREYFGREYLGKMLGIVMGSAAIGGIVGPTLAGWVFDSVGSYQILWLAFAGAISLAVLLVLKVRP
jgi:OFA family oxalate/formate antiporter-like MFS transporter